MTDSARPNGPLMIDLESTQLNDRERNWLQHDAVGGLILFTRNYASRQQLKQLVQDIRALRPNILIAVDHEGGRVQRFRPEFSSIPAMSKLGLLYRTDPSKALAYAHSLGWLMASELLCEDIDFSFAPVLDLDYGRSNVIGDRAFSNHKDSLLKLAQSFIEGMQSAGMASTGKHFPGHGYVELDSHLALPVDDRDRSEVMDDVSIFAELSHVLDGMMPAHVIYSAVDDRPAGFSPIWCQSILREEIGFSGVIFSDDLSMEGAAAMGGYPSRTIAALEAGCDMVLLCNNPTAIEEVLSQIELPVNNNQSRLDRMRRRQYAFDSYQSLSQSQQWLDTQAVIQQLENLR